MSAAGGSWWLDDGRTWRHGTPPAGWQQRRDGRWQPPDHRPDDITEELTVLAPPWRVTPARGTPRWTDDGTPAHRASVPPEPPRWRTIAVPALAAVIVLATIGLLVSVARGGEREAGKAQAAAAEAGSGPPGPPTTGPPGPGPAQGSAGATDPAGSGDSGIPSEAAPPATDAGPTNTAPPATPGDDPLAACSAGQRQLIEKGNHSPEWYRARFDADGDGVLCA